MKTKELSKLSRLEILELLLEQSKEVERLNQEINELKEKVENKPVISNELGSLAEVSLEINSILENAQKAADIYLNNVKQMNRRQVIEPVDEDIYQKSQDMLAQTQYECERLKEETRKECKLIIDKARQEVQNEWLEFNRYKQKNMFNKKL